MIPLVVAVTFACVLSDVRIYIPYQKYCWEKYHHRILVKPLLICMSFYLDYCTEKHIPRPNSNISRITTRGIIMLQYTFITSITTWSVPSVWTIASGIFKYSTILTYLVTRWSLPNITIRYTYFEYSIFI
jgi:hypothetical protein